MFAEAVSDILEKSPFMRKFFQILFIGDLDSRKLRRLKSGIV